MTESTRPESPTPAGQSGVPEQRETGPAAADVEELQRQRAEEDELRRLRVEAEELRARLADRERRRHRRMVARRVVAAVLVVVAAFGTAASVVGIWAARTTLNTDRWVATVRPLPADPQVAEAMSIYLTDEVFRVLDVRQRVAEALPPKAAFVAGPVTNGVRDYIQGTVEDVLQTEQFQQLWVNLNRRAHERILAVIEGESGTVQVQGDRVTLNLLPVFNNVLALLEDRAPTLFGKPLNLPEITNGQIPPGLETRIETALGVDLPSNFSRFTIYRGQELNALQDAVAAFKKYLVLLVLGTLVALGLALWASPWRRRTVLQYGVWLSVAVLTVATVLRAVRNQILSDVPAGAFQDGAAAASRIIFSTLRERANQLVWLGVVIALVAYLVGPGRGAVWLRRSVARGSRASWAWVQGLATGRESSAWVRERLDALRIGGVVVAGVLALLLSSWTSLLVLLVLLGAYELAVTLVARPQAAMVEQPPAATSGGARPG
ncbi:MAG TPA: hypothetical protein VF314_17390 [Actinomycetes bacterium]